MRNWIYCMFILEYTVDYGENAKLVREVHEDCFSSKKEMKNYIKINFENSDEFEYLEVYKGSRKTELTYVYRIVFH